MLWIWTFKIAILYNNTRLAYVLSLHRNQIFETPWTAAHQAPLSMGFSKQDYCSGLPFPFPGDPPNPGIEPTSLASPTLAGGFLPISVTWEGQHTSSVQSLSRVQLFATPWTAACQASLSITNSRSFLKLMSFKSMVPTNHLILCHLLLQLPLIFPSIRVFSKESVLCIRWLKYWSCSFSISPSNEYSGLISFRKS